MLSSTSWFCVIYCTSTIEASKAKSKLFTPKWKVWKLKEQHAKGISQGNEELEMEDCHID